MAVIEARKAVELYFQYFNEKNSNGIPNTIHFPHVRIDPEGRINILKDKAEARQSHDMVFSKLVERDGWSHSTLDSIEGVHESDVKVHFKIEFSRYKSDDTRYSVCKSLWIISLRDGEWKILARSSYAQ
jgi:hypothetical protein